MRVTTFGRCGLAALAVGALTACGEQSITAPRADTAAQVLESRQSLSRHILVLVEEDAPSGDLREEIARLGGRIDRSHDAFGVLSVFGLSDRDAAALALRADVDGIDRDMMVKWVPGFDEVATQLVEAPTDLTDQSGAFFYAQGMQWNIDIIDANDAWLQSNQGAGQVVAVLDTGGDPFHIDLAGKILGTSISALTPGSSPCGAFDENNIYDLNYHGSFVSGLITSNGLGMASVAPDASILTVKVLNCSGSGSFDDVIYGIAYAADLGADVINMSLGAYFLRNADGARSLIRALTRAVRYAQARGSLLVAAAGNDGINLDHDGDLIDGDHIHVPSQLDGVMAVGATAPVAQMDFDALASYTNYGHTGVDLMAPGGDLVAGGVCAFSPTFRCDLVISVLSSFLVPGPNFYAASGGTSFASPHVAGALAVVQSTNDSDAAWCVLRGADDPGDIGADEMYGLGRLNVVGALNCGHYVHTW